MIGFKRNTPVFGKPLYKGPGPTKLGLDSYGVELRSSSVKNVLDRAGLLLAPLSTSTVSSNGRHENSNF